MLALPLIKFQAQDAAPDSAERAGHPITVAAGQAPSASSHLQACTLFCSKDLKDRATVTVYAQHLLWSQEPRQ